MDVSVGFAPGRIIRWRKRRFVVVDCTGFDTIIAREVGKRRLERIPVAEAQPDHSINQRATSVTNLVTIPEEEWQTAVKQFTILKPLFEMDAAERTRSNVEQKGDYDSEGRAIMTRAELEKWFTIYVAKVYANTFHRGIKTTPLAKYKEGILGTDDRPGIGLPDRVAEPTAFMLDFMPFEERTIQEYGVAIDHIYYWDDALRPWIHARDPEDSRRPRKFTFRIIPRDMREIYFRDPASNTYIAIPYRDRTRPPVSRWEIQAAEKRLREAGYAQVDEVLIFQAVEEMRRLEQESEHKTKKARRAREMRHRPPRHPCATPAKPGPKKTSSSAVTIPGTDRYADRVEAFEGIVEPD